MVGFESTIIPLIGTEEFSIASKSLVISFIVSFGITKACANLVSGQLADRFGRKPVFDPRLALRLSGSFLDHLGASWSWIVAANVLLGLNQGFAWSMTVFMKIDLVGPRSRGLAVGLNEFAGYLAVGVTAFLTGYLASHYGLRPVPIYLGVGYAVFGMLFSILLVRDTREHVHLERPPHAFQQHPSASVRYLRSPPSRSQFLRCFTSRSRQQSQ